jgi:hypothetical protein
LYVIVNVQSFGFFVGVGWPGGWIANSIVSPRPADARICFFAFKISERSVLSLKGETCYHSLNSKTHSIKSTPSGHEARVPNVPGNWRIKNREEFPNEMGHLPGL